MIYWKNIIPGPSPPDIVYALIEIPKHSAKKLEISKNTNLLLLDRILHSSVVYPQDYGFIPGTLAQDGDALDILLLINTPTYPKTLIRSKPIGVMIMEDEKGIDEKILAVAINDPFFNVFDDIKDLPQHFLDEIREFFKTYKNLENEKYSEIKSWLHREEAFQVIQESIDRFKEKYGDIANIDPVNRFD